MAAGQGYDSSIAITPLDPGGWLGYPAAHAKSADAQVAQLVEHATENRSVGGSIPPLGTIPTLPDPSLCHPSQAGMSITI